MQRAYRRRPSTGIHINVNPHRLPTHAWLACSAMTRHLSRFVATLDPLHVLKVAGMMRAHHPFGTSLDMPMGVCGRRGHGMCEEGGSVDERVKLAL